MAAARPFLLCYGTPLQFSVGVGGLLVGDVAKEHNPVSVSEFNIFQDL
jgi:hypothetical protein